jgi:F-type H+-transporting ATPase subunit delta
MTHRTVAARYARALFDISQAGGDLRQVEVDLVRFQDLVNGHDTLSRVLVNPAVPSLRKRAIVVALLNRLKNFLPSAGRLVTLLADRDRLGFLPDIIRFYRKRLREHFGVVEAHVTTVQPLDPKQLALVEGQLSEASGRKVEMSASVDPTILGGIVARLGSTVYDGSVANHLERIRNSLLEK